MTLLPQEEAQQSKKWEGYVDWRNRPALVGRHGGKVAALFVLGTHFYQNPHLSIV